jgi:hypothetical protein
MSVSATLPDGSKVCLAEVPDWDFNWQATYTYKSQIAAPFGTGVFLTSRYDNSDNNIKNPNSPPKAVSWGENTTDEMCIAFLSFTLDSENLTGRSVSTESAMQLDAVEPFLRDLWAQFR